MRYSSGFWDVPIHGKPCGSDDALMGQWPETQFIRSFPGRLTLAAGQAHTGHCVSVTSVQSSDQEPPEWSLFVIPVQERGWRKKELLNASRMTQRLP